MKTARILILLLSAQLFILAAVVSANGTATDTVSPRTRCPVCGMFVAKYPNWVTQIQYEDSGKTRFFDGVKDMMVLYFDPERYMAPPREAIRNIYVKDYYSLSWISAQDAFYVIGSDVYGPMGHELIPFESKGAAESFLKDHHGKEILAFGEITSELIDSLRVARKMR